MRRMAAAVAMMFACTWGGTAMATISGPVFLASLKVGGVKTAAQFGLLNPQGSWGSAITRSSCAALDGVGVDNVSSSIQSPLWDMAKLAFSLNKAVIVTTNDSECVNVGGSNALVPMVTNIEIVN